MLHAPLSFLESLLSDDCPYEDLTTEGLGIGRRIGRVIAAPKAEGIVAGIGIAAQLFELRGVRTKILAEDGAALAAGEPALEAEGSAEALHAVYKTAQNVMEYASGIANRTAAMTAAARAENSAVQVALTRKHFPGAKLISYAGALAGGGIIHRFGLSDSILVFDQHRVFCSDSDEAIRRLIASAPERKVAVEADSPEEALHFVQLGIHIIQCERFEPEQLERFVREAKTANPALIVNAAGGVTAENAAAYARAGADVLVTSWPYFGRPFDIKMRFACGDRT